MSCIIAHRRIILVNHYPLSHLHQACIALKSSKNVQFLIYKSFTTKVILSFRQQDQLRSSMEGGVSRINIPKEQLFADQKGRLTALGDRV